MQRRNLLKRGLTALASVPLLGAVAGTASWAFIGRNKLKLRIGHLPITDHLLVIAAGQQNFRHVELQPVKFSSWPEAAEALRAGAVDGAFLLTPIGLTLRQRGATVKVVLLGHRNGSVITVKTSGDINSVAEPFGAQAEAQKVGKILKLSKDIWPDHICCVLNLQERLIAAQPEAVQDLVSGLTRTAAFIKENPAEAAKGSVKFLGQSPRIIETVLTTPKGRITFDNLVPAADDFAATQDLMIEFGLAKAKVDLTSYLDSSFALRA